jgi:hypothetical protein
VPAKNVLKRLLLVGVSTLLALAVAELALRYHYRIRDQQPGDLQRQLAESAKRTAITDEPFNLMGLVKASPFPGIVYELKPNLNGTFRGQHVRTNALGLRGPDAVVAKTPGTFRIAGIGDSEMFGWGVAQGEEYLEVLQHVLNSAPAGASQPAPQAKGCRRYEVLNFGTPGYNGWMEVSTFEHRVMAFKPDLLIMHFVGNDFDLPHFMQPPESDRGRSYLADFFRARFGKEPEPEQGELLPHNIQDLPQEMRERTRSQYAYMTGAGHYREAMDRLGRLTRSLGIPVIVLSQGADNETGRVCREASDANGFLSVDASPRFYSYLVDHNLSTEHQNWLKTFRFPHDGHPNALGHGLFADALIAELRQRGYAPALPAAVATPETPASAARRGAIGAR